ncbi:MAG: ABC transporter substrate-binding protein [Oscillospiraceae bacterium]|nr:ABC transporter substrate-binding protein [Oscillospiraceae bacterium]
MKKLLVLTLALLLCLGLLSACGGDAATTPTSDNTTDPTSGGEDPTDNPPAEVAEIVWQQIGGMPSNVDKVVAAMNDYTRDKIGVVIKELRFFDWGDYDKSIQTLLTTGGDYDITFIHTRFYNGAVLNNQLMNIAPYLSSVPALKSFIPDQVWQGVTNGGAVYGVPTYKDSAMTQYVAFDKAMVDKYDIDINSIKSLQDLDPILRKIKTGEEAESGGTVYPLPLIKEGLHYVLMYQDPNTWVRYDDATGTCSNYFETDTQLKADLELLHKWWEDGIINPDASTKEEADKYRICYVWQAFPGAAASETADKGYEIVIAPMSITLFSNDSIQGSINAISPNCKNPEAALKYLELVNTDPKLRNMFAFGMPDEDWTDNGDGTITRIPDNAWTAPAYSQATFFVMSPVAPNSPEQWSMVKEEQDKGIAHVMLGFALDTGGADGFESEKVQVDAVIEKYRPELLTGAYQGSTADYLAKLTAELKAAGLDKVLTETQKQVDAFMGR